MRDLVRCRIRKPFTFTLDGVQPCKAVSGEVDLPAHLVAGLEREGYIIRKNAGGAPENKALGGAPQNKRYVSKGPGGRWFVVENGRRVSRAFATEDEAAEAC